MPSSLYIHIPFCVKKCDYCDFLSFGMAQLEEKESENYKKINILNEKNDLNDSKNLSNELNDFNSKSIRTRYMKALCKEIENLNISNDKSHCDNDFTSLQNEYYIGNKHYGCKDIKNYKTKLKTIFIGGGTPSILNLDEINMLGVAIKKTFDLSELEEFTIEVNPESVDLEKILAWKNIGVNRISMGVQSSTDDELQNLGRIHSWEMAQSAYNILRKARINNINIDIMFSLPNQTFEQWQNTIENIIKLNPEHISAYSLIVEEGTKFYNMYENGILNLPSEEDDRKMYHYLINRLMKDGYYQYEISNFSKKNRECRHNLVYWNAYEYYGVGLGASGYVNGVRVSNYTDFDKYINSVMSGDTTICTKELIDNKQAEFEKIMLGFRLNKGVDIVNFKNKFGFKPYQKWESIIDKWIRLGGLIYASEDNRDYLRLTDYGRDIANTVISDFL